MNVFSPLLIKILIKFLIEAYFITTTSTTATTNTATTTTTTTTTTTNANLDTQF